MGIGPAAADARRGVIDAPAAFVAGIPLERGRALATEAG